MTEYQPLHAATERPGARPTEGPAEASRTGADGRVVTAEGWPVVGATVTAIGGDGSQLARTTSDDDGRFTFDALVPGAATLLVASPSHQPKASSVVVPASSDWSIGEITLTRQAGQELPAPGLYVIDTAHSTISAKAHHLGLATVTGRFHEFSGAITVDPDISRSRVDAEIVATSITTGNDQRDTHLRSADFLDVTHHPTLRFEADRVERAADGWAVPGRLTLVGTTRPVLLQLTYLGSGPDPWGGTRAAFTATAELRRRDFQLNWNQAVDVGIAVFGTTLRIMIDIEAVLQP